MNKWEMHIHTAEGSKCGRVSAQVLVEAYKRAGYTGIVITDHYNELQLSGPGTAEEKRNAWMRGYENARRAGERLGLTVLFGLEARVNGSLNDYLIYGVEPEFVLENPELYQLTLAELYVLCRSYNGVMIQAHPNRKGCQQVPPEFVDGYEVFNGNPRQDNRNQQTRSFVRGRPELIQTGGSDYHWLEDMGICAMVTEEEILTSARVAQCLRDGKLTVMPAEGME